MYIASSLQMVDSISYLNKFDDDIGGNVVDVQLYIEETLMGPIKLPEGEIKHVPE